MNRDQLVDTMAMHLYNRFSGESRSYSSLDQVERLRWKMEAEDALTITGVPEEELETLVKTKIEEVNPPGMYARMVNETSANLLRLSVQMVDVIPCNDGWKTERLLRACGITLDEYQKNPNILEGQEVNSRVGVIKDIVHSGRTKLRIINYEPYKGRREEPTK